MFIDMSEDFGVRLKKARTEKDLRLLTQKFFKESLKGLPAGFRIEAKVLSVNPPRVIVKIPAHSEGNPIRIAQVDQLIEELENLGLEVILCYQDDLEELDVRKL
ncbi:hypothetical protein [Thermodesulfatator autotrophicus]|uniref:Uncharacterized protein n=1 Tax=Thermodesulfatator autotrophicus TaxID=1795632 RepID=A0A177E8T3_9BACT|nr:hypothetical protein [Thermodesulfatator autotrophicus]OAG28367.1 hypothetical protein TH606_01965 [Thermodesulfatator autotrophicus]